MIDSTAKPNFVLALRYWFKLGCISFGGPAGQIAIMHQDLVESKQWISEERFAHALRFCMTLPGPEAQQLATFIGWTLHGIRGGIAAGTLFVLPSFFVLLGVSWTYAVFGSTAWMVPILYGVKPAVVALVAYAAWRMGSRTLKGPLFWFLALASFVATTWLHLAFPWVLIVAALVGWVANPGNTQKTSGSSPGPASNVGEEKAKYANPSPRWSSLVKVWITGFGLWLLPLAGLGLGLGWHHPWIAMAWFFTKAAWLTFGGAYAVLPYVFQAAVHKFGWLTPTQMMDGLALGESTPGPLIMVVAYIAFMGGYSHPSMLGDIGIAYPFWVGLISMIVATWFTFLPSFLFILSGAPWIDAMHGENRWTGPMTAMSAAVVGVIGQLGIRFGSLVIWPHGTNHAVDGAALFLIALSGIALIRYRISVPLVIALSAGIGWAWMHFQG